MSRRDEVLEAAAQRLGNFDVVADHSWDIGLAVVLEVVSAGGTFFIKGHAEERRFEIEVAAYADVVPALGDRAPVLQWADRQRRVIATSQLQGVPPSAKATTAREERSIHHGAGEVLRLLHSAQPAADLPKWAESRIERLEQWIARAPDGLLEAGDIDFARAQVSLLTECDSPVGVVCHGDWQPRNWLVDVDCNVLTFDFERVQTEWWCHDLQRLWWREWDGRPDLAEAHFEGYGRAPSDDEIAMLMATSAAGHVTQIIWATEHGDPDFAEAGRQHLATMRIATSQQ